MGRGVIWMSKPDLVLYDSIDLRSTPRALVTEELRAISFYYNTKKALFF